MRIGVVGLGSMGKRRVRDLLALGHEVIGHDCRSDRNREAEERFQVPTVSDLNALLARNPEAIVISTPPDQHISFYKKCFDKGLPFFSEANIFVPQEEWFAERELKSKIKGYPSATWRFHPLVRLLRTELQSIGLDKVYSVHHTYADHLTRWHPWEPYYEFYAGKSRTTCAAREMVPFELEWLCWLFGPVRAVCAIRDRRAHWKTDIHDSYLLLLEFDSGLRGSLNVELHQVVSFRIARISCKDRGMWLDFESDRLCCLDLGSGNWCALSPWPSWPEGFDFEQVYHAEIRAFVDALSGVGTYPKTWTEERHLSDVLFAAEESWRRREWVNVAEVRCSYDGESWVEGADRE